MNTNKTAEIQATEQQNPFFLNVFGPAKEPDAICVPNLPFSTRNNCQSGKWTIGDEDYGSKLAMTVVKFSKFFGSLGQTHNTLWGQIWFVAEAGDIPQDVVMCTYIKGRSLSDFNRVVTEATSKGLNPADGVFVPNYVKHAGQKPDEGGVLKPINYYSLKWDWYKRGSKFPSTSDPILKQLDAESDKSINRLKQICMAMSDEENKSYLMDLEGTKMMTCIDGMAPQEVARVMAVGGNPVAVTAALALAPAQ